MAPDLRPLERAAERVGLGGLRARVVPADPRRDTWFTWNEKTGELTVSERVIERCPPDDAAALLICEVLRKRRLARFGGWLFRGSILVVALIMAVFASINRDTIDPFQVAGLWVVPVFLLCGWVSERMRAAMVADDETVSLLQDAEPLVRALNRMRGDEIVLGSHRATARPDLHRRAERLAQRHRLCGVAREGDGGEA